MTRTDVVASGRPRGEVATRRFAARSRVARACSALILAAGLVTPASALAASEGLGGYTTTTTTTTTTTPPTTTTTPPTTTTTPTTPTTPTTTTTPTKGESPSKETSTTSTTPTPTTTTPGAETPATTSAKASTSSTLPFTGFDLRWSLLVGLALIAAGISLLVIQRRRRGAGR
jgi:LPXTG-motif cell wall-anchored protein